MSVTTSPERQLVQCGQCDDQYPQTESVAGSFCSQDCHLRSKGEGALAQIDSDHRFCSTCYRQVKTVERPPDAWVEDATSMIQAALDAGATVTQYDGHLALDATDAATRRRTAGESVIGYQYPTESARPAEDIRPVQGTDRIERTQTRGVYGCECGAIDLRKHDGTLASIEGADMVFNLAACLRHLHAEGALQRQARVGPLVDALLESKDLSLAVGASLYGVDP